MRIRTKLFITIATVVTVVATNIIGLFSGMMVGVGTLGALLFAGYKSNRDWTMVFLCLVVVAIGSIAGSVGLTPSFF